MNIEKININSFNNVYNKNNSFEKGDIINGHIKDLKGDMYTIDLENKTSINVHKDKIVGDVGDNISFKVLDNKNTLKQLISKDINPYNLDKPLENKTIKPIALDENISKNMAKSQKQYKIFLDKNTQPFAKENFVYSSNVKNSLSHLSNALNKKDIQKFINEGINPKNLDVLTFSDFLSISTGVDVEGKEKPEEKTLTQLKEDKKKAMKMDLNMNGIDEEALLSFETILSNVGLPKTPKNLLSLENVKEKLENIKAPDKYAALNLIKKESPITINDLYTSKYLKLSDKNQVSIDQIKDIDSQLENILKQNDIEPNYENIEKYQKLINIKDQINIEYILKKSAKNILKNDNALNVNIFDSQDITKSYNIYKNILPKISKEHIQI